MKKFSKFFLKKLFHGTLLLGGWGHHISLLETRTLGAWASPSRVTQPPAHIYFPFPLFPSSHILLSPLFQLFFSDPRFATYRLLRQPPPMDWSELSVAGSNSSSWFLCSITFQANVIWLEFPFFFPSFRNSWSTDSGTLFSLFLPLCFLL